MKRTRIAASLATLLAVSCPALAQNHPASTSNCGSCHTYGKGPAGAPKVTPTPPSWLEKLMGKKSYQGHPSVSCVGTVTAEGKVTGCHRIEGGAKDYLVMNLAQRPSDELCGACHADQRKLGNHHPSYKVDKNHDGIPDTVVRPAPTQEVYSTFLPSLRPEPLKSHPDSLSLLSRPDGSLLLQSVLPLETVVEMVEGKPVTEPNVMTCDTCHNPHFGYLVEVGKDEALDPEKVARKNGDAGLRLRDFNNQLCVACH